MKEFGKTDEILDDFWINIEGLKEFWIDMERLEDFWKGWLDIERILDRLIRYQNIGKID